MQKPGVARSQGQAIVEVGERLGRAALFDRDGTELKQLVGLCLNIGHGGVGHVNSPRGVNWNVRAVSESMLIVMSSRSAGRAFGARDGHSTNTQHRPAVASSQPISASSPAPERR